MLITNTVPSEFVDPVLLVDQVGSFYSSSLVSSALAVLIALLVVSVVVWGIRKVVA